MMKKEVLLFFTILIEGYVVLAVELLAMRQLMPFVGSGIEVISVIISAVLLPLAVGYYAGSRRYGKECRKKKSAFSKKHPVTVRRILLKNILTALIILTMGLSSLVLSMFFEALHLFGSTNHILNTFIYGGIFLVTPVFCLGQTIPLVSLYFSHSKLSEMTGKMLFFSTVGSFLGSVVSTIILMTVIGVNNTVIVTLGLLVLLSMLLARAWNAFDNVMVLTFLAIAVWLNHSSSLREVLHVVADTPYNLVAIKEDKDGVSMILNNSHSSKYAADPTARFPYIRYIEEYFIEPVDAAKPRDILVFGAGAFTLGVDDTVNRYTFVDIDPTLQALAEQHVLPEKLGANKKFVPNSARMFLNKDQKKYDLVVVDLFSNTHSIPMEAITQEFLLKVKERLKPEGFLVANVIASPTFADRFSVRYNNTFASVFPVFSRQIITKKPFHVATPKLSVVNVLYIAPLTDLANDREIYTDNRNTYSLDRRD